MKILLTAALVLGTLTACQDDETARAYGAADRIWTLSEINGAPFPATATLTFPVTGEIAGHAPCNSYSAPMTTPYPWFEVKQIASTRMACPDLDAESDFFTALTAVSISEVSGDTLILSNPDGLSMIFKAAD